jgi:hypothetical protein
MLRAEFLLQALLLLQLLLVNGTFLLCQPEMHLLQLLLLPTLQLMPWEVLRAQIHHQQYPPPHQLQQQQQPISY